jgi:hypothetical protein
MFISLLGGRSESDPESFLVLFSHPSDPLLFSPTSHSFNDVSFHGSTQVPTPHIDAIANSGIKLMNYHVQPVCSPTRATFMSGRYLCFVPRHPSLRYPPTCSNHELYAIWYCILRSTPNPLPSRNYFFINSRTYPPTPPACLTVGDVRMHAAGT